jgi:hypothetical protein
LVIVDGIVTQGVVAIVLIHVVNKLQQTVFRDKLRER